MQCVCTFFFFFYVKNPNVYTPFKIMQTSFLFQVLLSPADKKQNRSFVSSLSLQYIRATVVEYNRNPPPHPPPTPYSRLRSNLTLRNVSYNCSRFILFHPELRTKT